MQSPAEPDDCVSKYLRTPVQNTEFHKLIISMHAVVHIRLGAAKGNPVFKMMHIGAAADCDRLSLFTKVQFIGFQKFSYQFTV